MSRLCRTARRLFAVLARMLGGALPLHGPSPVPRAAASAARTAGAGSRRADRELTHAWMLGQVSDEQVCAWLAARTGIPAELLHGLLRVDCARMRPNSALLDVLGTLPSQTRLIVATDNARCCSDALLALPDMSRFERVLCSAELGAVKTTPVAFFGSCLRELGVEFADCVLIDDSLDGCDAFTRAGGTSIRYEQPGQAAAELPQSSPGRERDRPAAGRGHVRDDPWPDRRPWPGADAGGSRPRAGRTGVTSARHCPTGPKRSATSPRNALPESWSAGRYSAPGVERTATSMCCSPGVCRRDPSRVVVVTHSYPAGRVSADRPLRRSRQPPRARGARSVAGQSPRPLPSRARRSPGTAARIAGGSGAPARRTLNAADGGRPI